MANIDVSGYQGWQKIVTPSGGVYYAVPGTSWVYDPFASQSAGHSVFKKSPKVAVDAYNSQKEAEEAQKKANSPGMQVAKAVVPVATSLGTLYLANEIMKPSTPAAVEAIKASEKAFTNSASATIPSSQVASVTPTASAPTVAPVPTTSAEAFTNSGATSGALQPPNVVSATRVPGAGPYPVGTAADGGTLMSDGSIASTVPTQNGGVTGTQIGQGALGAAQVYQGYQDFKQGDNVGGTINTTAGAAAIGTAMGSETAAEVLPIAGPIAGAYGFYKMEQMVGDMPTGGKRNSNATLQGAAAGAAIGSAIPVVGTAIGALVGAAIGFASSYFGSSKDKYQMMRDAGRSVLKEHGILDDNYQGTLADGTLYDFGKDGKEAGKLNTSDPNWGQIAAMANVVAVGEGSGGKGLEAMATMYTNAALSNSGGDLNKAMENIKHFAMQRGMTMEDVQAQIDKMADKDITIDQAAAYKAGAAQLFAGMPRPVAVQTPGQPPKPAQLGQPPPTGSKVVYPPKTAQTQPPPGSAPLVPVATPLATPPPYGPGSVVYKPPDPNAPLPTLPPGQLLDPGYNMDGPYRPPADAATNPNYAPVVVTNSSGVPSNAVPVPRSVTRSPGISMTGRHLTSQEIGEQLAQRINARH